MARDNEYRIDILDTALAVLETFLHSNGKSKGASEIARELEITRSRAFRILKSLEAHDYVEFDETSQRYRLGLKLLEMGEVVRNQIDVRRVAAPFLEELARQTGDVAHLLVLHGNFAVCIERFQGSHSLQGAAPIGMPLPLHVGASPKLLLAYLPEAEREQHIKDLKLISFTPKTITDVQNLRDALEHIQQQGYAIDEGDYEIGIMAVGAPVRDHTGRVVAGVTLTTPATRWDDTGKHTCIDLTVQTAAAISTSLGFRKERGIRP